MKDTSTAAIIPIAGSAILLNVSPDKVPIRKEVTLRVISVFINLIVLIPALRKEDTVIPASIMVVRELSAIYASAYMASVVKSAPTNELPAGIIMAFIGGPFFMYLLLKKKGGRRINA